MYTPPFPSSLCSLSNFALPCFVSPPFCPSIRLDCTSPSPSSTPMLPRLPCRRDTPRRSGSPMPLPPPSPSSSLLYVCPSLPHINPPRSTTDPLTLVALGEFSCVVRCPRFPDSLSLGLRVHHTRAPILRLAYPELDTVPTPRDLLTCPRAPPPSYYTDYDLVGSPTHAPLYLVLTPLTVPRSLCIVTTTARCSCPPSFANKLKPGGVYLKQHIICGGTCGRDEREAIRKPHSCCLSESVLTIDTDGRDSRAAAVNS
ncbi:hypothetical protein DFH06DRAFT_676346 [Mycena polygramma]|nr:hypothetical protein DFH06DRAFT_676346 [Mycena polygramma]